MSKPTALTKRQGGSYRKDPKTGKVTLIERTQSVDEALANNKPATAKQTKDTPS